MKAIVDADSFQLISEIYRRKQVQNFQPDQNVTIKKVWFQCALWNKPLPNAIELGVCGFELLLAEFREAAELSIQLQKLPDTKHIKFEF